MYWERGNVKERTTSVGEGVSTRAVRGHNIIEIHTWKKAAILKQLWAISKKKDSLYIKWVHYYFIKKKRFGNYGYPQECNLVVRKIIESPEVLINSNSADGY